MSVIPDMGHASPEPEVAPLPVDPKAHEMVPGLQVLAAFSTLPGTHAGSTTRLTARADELWSVQHVLWSGASRGEIVRHHAVQAYRALSSRIGISPDREPPSIQALIQRGLRGRLLGQWPRINPVVDLLNAVAVTDMVALGAFDADRLTGAVRVTLSRGGEPFQALGTTHPEELAADRLVLADDARVLSLFAHRDGVHQKITAQTERVLVLGCVVPGIAPDAVAESVLRAAVLLSCTGAEPERRV